jgi:hypothetical protein
VKRQSVLTMAAIVIAASCDSKTPAPTAPPATIYPRIVSTFPADGATGVPLTTDTIKVVFNKPMSSGSLEYFTNVFGFGGNSPGQTIFAFNSKYDSATNTFSFPVSGLRSLYTYKVIVGNGMPATDLAFNSLEGPNSFTFTTADGGQPRVIGSDPADGEKDVDPMKPLRVNFSEALDPLTVGPGTVIVVPNGVGTNGVGRVTYDSVTHSAVFTPTTPLRNAAYYIMRLAVIRDMDGVAMDGYIDIHFVTR